MMKVAKPSLTTAIYFGSALLCAFCTSITSYAWIGVAFFTWLGSIDLLNAAAPRLPFPRLIHWLHAMTFEIFALLYVAFLRFTPRKESVSGSGTPILLVHGYMNHSSVWKFQKKRLEAAGLGPIYSINLGHPFRSIEKYAEKVKEKAEEIAKETGKNELILIGHSMGGLVSSWYAAQVAESGTVKQVITIGSPLSGTPVAYVALGPNGRQMQPGSTFIKQLQTAMAQNTEVQYHHIATKSDQLVIPGASAALKQNPHLIIEDVGHASLLYTPRVTKQICDWLLLS